MTIPYDHRALMMNLKLGLFESNKIYYPKPWPVSLKVANEGGEYYKVAYRLPFIESQDKTTGDTASMVRLPETSDFLDDQMHGVPIPIYTFDKNKLLVSMWFEPKFYVYDYVGGQFTYEKTVEVNIPEWVYQTPTSFDDLHQYSIEARKKVTGTVPNILVTDSYYIVVYNNRLTEDQLITLSSARHVGIARKKKNPYYAAIFDKEFNQLAADVAFPIASNFPLVVNNDGELVVSKVAGLSETEDDGVILYKLKLKPEE